MKKVKWKLIDIDTWKKWAEALKFDASELSAEAIHQQNVSKEEYYATEILTRLASSFYDSDFREIKEGEDAFPKDKIDMGELPKDLFDLWIAAQEYWRSKRDLSMLNKIEIKELERKLTSLNNYIDSNYE